MPRLKHPKRLDHFFPLLVRMPALSACVTVPSVIDKISKTLPPVRVTSRHKKSPMRSPAEIMDIKKTASLWMENARIVCIHTDMLTVLIFPDRVVAS